MAKVVKCDVKFRIWFYSGTEKLLGIGRVELLEKIIETGSITNAAKSMGMSYRQAWQMVAEMNERSKLPFVIKQLGGINGGGAIVTDAGKRAIAKFYLFENKVRLFIKKEAKGFSL